MKNLFRALAHFQSEVPIIHKGSEGYGYSYADLATIIEVITPILKDCELGFTQIGTDNGLKTVLFHYESGESIESVFEVPQNVTLAKMNEFQVLGSAITYIRRYALSAILGLVTDKDTDAQTPSKENAQNEVEKPWFNDKDRQGNVTQEWNDFVAKASEVGKQTAMDELFEKFKVNKTIRAMLKEFVPPPPAKMTRKQGMELIASKITVAIDEKLKNEIAYELTDSKHKAIRQKMIDDLNAGDKPADVLTYLIEKK